MSERRLYYNPYVRMYEVLEWEEPLVELSKGEVIARVSEVKLIELILKEVAHQEDEIKRRERLALREPLYNHDPFDPKCPCDKCLR